MPTRETESPGFGPAAKQVAEHASALARLELELAALEIKRKVVSLGLGIGFGVGAAIFLLVDSPTSACVPDPFRVSCPPLRKG